MTTEQTPPDFSANDFMKIVRTSRKFIVPDMLMWVFEDVADDEIEYIQETLAAMLADRLDYAARRSGASEDDREGPKP